MSLTLKIPPLLLTVGLLALMAGLAAITPGLAVAPEARLVAAALLGVTGATVVVLAVAGFRRAMTTVNPLDPGAASALVDRGIYRISRNPMYLGFLLILLGWAAWLANPAALLVAAAFVPYMNRYQIVPEERILEQQFGAAYRRYRQSVRRWI